MGEGDVVHTASHHSAFDPPPADLDVGGSLSRLRLVRVEASRPGLERWLRAFRETCAGGGAEAAAFRIEGLDACGRWLIRNRYRGWDLGLRILLDPEVAAAVGVVIGERYEQCTVERTSDAWSGWFSQGSWDATWIVTDVLRHGCTVIATTDDD